jgi:hypothetical protein
MKVLKCSIAFASWFVIAFALAWNFNKTSDPTVHDPRIIRAIDVSAPAISEPPAEGEFQEPDIALKG